MNIGKEKCKALRQVRKNIAQANDIDYIPAECNHKGECLGTCHVCEQEMQYIESQIRSRRRAGKVAVVVGTALGLTAITSSCSHSNPFHRPDVVGIVPAFVDTVPVNNTDTTKTPDSNMVKAELSSDKNK